MTSKKQYTKFINNAIDYNYLYACETGNVKYLKQYIHKIDFNCADNESNTGIMIAVYHNRPNIIQFFINRNLINKDPSKSKILIIHKNVYGYNVLHLALLHNDGYDKQKIIKILTPYFDVNPIISITICYNNLELIDILMRLFIIISPSFCNSSSLKILYYIIKNNLAVSEVIVTIFKIDYAEKKVNFGNIFIEDKYYSESCKIYDKIYKLICNTRYLKHLRKSCDMPNKYITLFSLCAN